MQAPPLGLDATKSRGLTLSCVCFMYAMCQDAQPERIAGMTQQLQAACIYRAENEDLDAFVNVTDIFLQLSLLLLQLSLVCLQARHLG